MFGLLMQVGTGNTGVRETRLPTNYLKVSRDFQYTDIWFEIL